MTIDHQVAVAFGRYALGLELAHEPVPVHQVQRDTAARLEYLRDLGENLPVAGVVEVAERATR